MLALQAAACTRIAAGRVADMALKLRTDASTRIPCAHSIASQLEKSPLVD